MLTALHGWHVSVESWYREGRESDLAGFSRGGYANRPPLIHRLRINHQNVCPNPKERVERMTPPIPIRITGRRPHLLHIMAG